MSKLKEYLEATENKGQESVRYVLGSFLLLNLFGAWHRHFDSPIESDRKCARLAGSSAAHDKETSRTIQSGLAFFVQTRPKFILDGLYIKHRIPIPFRITCVVACCKPSELVKATVVGRYTVGWIIDKRSGKSAGGQGAPGTLKDEAEGFPRYTLVVLADIAQTFRQLCSDLSFIKQYASCMVLIARLFVEVYDVTT